MSIKDELLKAKLISKKDLKRLEHEERLERQKLGKDGLAEKKRQEEATVQEKQKAKKERDKEIARATNEVREEKERETRIENIVKQGMTVEGLNGNRKFYFVATTGSIPFLWVTEELAKKLEFGNAAIVETKSSGSFVVVNKKSAEQILQISPELVRFYHTAQS